MPSIFFRYGGQDHEIALLPDLAPVAIGQLLNTLPARIDIHCAKIAGQHIFWHAPFVADAEKATDIMTLPAGTFLYWPERQFLELIYGELQAETAAVSVLGRLTGDIGWLRQFGRDLVERHGRETLWAELVPGEALEGLAAPQPPQPPQALRFLVEARKAAWAAEPADIARLLDRRGLMLPFGPLAMAEGELRKLHELLWRLRGGYQGVGAAERPAFTAFLLEAFVARIEGFCGMHETGAVLLESARLLRDEPTLADAVIAELIPYTGRMAAWLDLYIPWNDVNSLTLGILNQRAGGTG